uniref:Ig-like domain-containing protein n=1 Tax=Salarias fasciatus TaxID=181472 RepID=A0A672IP32_SALFA
MENSPVPSRLSVPRRYVVFDNGTLYLNDVGTPEEGDYTCYAENQLGKDEMKIRVKVKAGASPPQIQGKDQKSLSVHYGETVTLRCDAGGEPPPVITWISPTNRVIAPALDKYQVLNDGTLVVQKVQRFDAGNYTCLARNKAGHDHKVTALEVLVTPPVISGLRGAAAIRVSAVQDQPKLLDCVAKGTPAPRVMWVLPGNVILPAPYYSKRMAVHLNGTLEIRSAKKTDSGQLTCIARNEGGEVKMVVDLTVKEAVARPQVRGPEADGRSLTVGNAMTLNCSLEGTALSHVTWILPSGTPLSAGARLSKFFHRPDGSLLISNPSMAEVGTYKCLGRYVGGLMERTVTLSPGRKPEISSRYDAPVSVTNGEMLLLHCQTAGDGVVLNRPQRAGRYAVLAQPRLFGNKYLHPQGSLIIQNPTQRDAGVYRCTAKNAIGVDSRSTFLNPVCSGTPSPSRDRCK